MAGLLPDNFYDPDDPLGLLPFSARWGAVQDAMRAGSSPTGASAFDIQGRLPGDPIMAAFGPPASGPPQMNGPAQEPLQAQPGYFGGSPETNPLLKPFGGPLQSGGPQTAQGPSAPAMGMPSLRGMAPAAPGLGDRLSAGFGGLANSDAPLPAIFNLISGLATGQRADSRGQAERLQGQAQLAAYRAVLAKTGDHATAMAAAANPELLKIMAPEIFGAPKVVQTGEGPLGKQFMLQQGRNFSPVPGSDSGPGGNTGIMAQGVKFDQNLTGHDYLNQFSPEVKAAVKAYMNGDVMPTGNPRLQGLTTFAKQVAQKVGQDLGIPVSDALYSEKRRYHSDLGSNSPSSAGGQSKAFVQGIEHALDLGDTLKKLENWNGFGIPIVAATANTIRQSLSNTQQAIADKAAGIGQTLAGEVGKLFSGSAGGGVHEREMTRARFSTVRSRPQLAAALEATLETMEGGLTALEARRDAVLGSSSGVELVPQQTRDKVKQLRAIIAELKGEAAAPASNESTTQPAAQAPIVPKEFQNKTQDEQLRLAPEGSRATIQGRRQVKKGGRWIDAE